MTWPVKASISQNFGENPTAGIRPGSPDYWIIQQFGNYQPDGHAGIDFAVPTGTEVSAVASGRVLHSGWMAGTYADNPWWVAPGFAGICVVIDHGTFIGVYGHLSKNIAPKNSWVNEGDAIGLSGDTGGSTGPHLHFEVLPDGYNLNARFYGRVNPLPYLGSASVGPAGDITETTELEEEDMPSAEDIAKAILRAPAYDGGKSVSHVLKALYEHDFVGGESMPDGKPLKDLINDNFTEVRNTLKNLTPKAGA